MFLETKPRVTKTYLDARLKDLRLTIGATIGALGGALVAIELLGH